MAVDEVTAEGAFNKWLEPVSVEDYNKLVDTFPEVDKVMLGRGVLANPGLLGEIKDYNFITKDILKAFHDEVFQNYIELFNDDKNAMFRMKELWGYMIYMFTDNKKYAKKIKKAQKFIDYKQAVSSLFMEQEIIKGAGLFNNMD